MDRWITLLTMVAVAAFVAIGCSGDGSPVTPAADHELTSESNLTGQTHTQLWGYYDVYIDIENRTAEAVPNRQVMFAVNVVRFINDPPANLTFQIQNIVHGTGYVDIDIDVTLRHPFPGMHKYDGYDVRGVFMGDASGTLAYNGSLDYPVLGTDQHMLDDPLNDDGGGPDGYTRWFNYAEFSTGGMPLFSYTQGVAATPGFDGTATLNPYRYFADGFGANEDVWNFLTTTGDNGVFAAGETNTRNYYLRFPDAKEMEFGYAIVADWKAPDVHPSNAAEAVACSVIDNSDVYYVDPTQNGGNIILDISLFGWEHQPSTIYIESTVLTAVASFDPSAIATGGGDHYSTYHIEIPADSVTTTHGNEFWVVAEYEAFDYSNPLGVPNEAENDPLAAFFRYDLTVLDEIPPWIEVTSPNGGEQWKPGTSETIFWTSGNLTGTVFIEYSKDNFVSDVNLIASDEPDDGNCIWQDIPFDPSPTVRVRVSSTENPSICDISDADFAIVEPWIEVLIPNGGEEWIAGTDEEITWASQYISGTVFIEYSKDNFVSDVNLIASDEPDDGTFTWDSVPFDFSDTVRVRVSWTDYPSVNDVSDDDFSIVDPGIVDCGWARIWGGPSGYGDAGWGVAVDGSGNVYVAGQFSSIVDFNPAGGDPHDSNGHEDVFLSKFDSSGNFVWARTWGGYYSDEGWGVATDGSGNVYVTGFFEATVDFDPDGGDPHTSNGDQDVFVSKFDSMGNFKWARTWGGPDDDWGRGVAADGSGNVYVTGEFKVTVDFDPGGGDPHTSNGFEDVFLSKFDSSGNFGWARTWGGSAWDYGQGVAADSSGNVYVTGDFMNTADFDPNGGDPHASNGLNDVFLSKFDSLGNFEWARTWGGEERDCGNGVAADGSGNVYVTGYFRGTVDFDPDGGDPHTSNNELRDVFLSKFDSSGNFEWARTWGGPQSDRGHGVAIDGSGNICVTGYFSDTADFDPDGGDPHTSNGSSDVFLSKFDSSGNFEWARTWGGSDDDEGSAVAADGSGNVYVTGEFWYTVDFAPTDLPCNADPDEHTSNGYLDAFLTRHLPDGCW